MSCRVVYTFHRFLFVFLDQQFLLKIDAKNIWVWEQIFLEMVSTISAEDSEADEGKAKNHEYDEGRPLNFYSCNKSAESVIDLILCPLWFTFHETEWEKPAVVSRNAKIE